NKTRKQHSGSFCKIMLHDVCSFSCEYKWDDIRLAMDVTGLRSALTQSHFCAKSENCDVICETKASENRCTFAIG
ncbi:MAG: hypothetical protein IJK08_12070, partial [Prevotella sp.]|nr:hypothetical protein [Prevotella sp.]